MSITKVVSFNVRGREEERGKEKNCCFHIEEVSIPAEKYFQMINCFYGGLVMGARNNFRYAAIPSLQHRL
jgi:hypothetical protein